MDPETESWLHRNAHATICKRKLRTPSSRKVWSTPVRRHLWNATDKSLSKEKDLLSIQSMRMTRQSSMRYSAQTRAAGSFSLRRNTRRRLDKASRQLLQYRKPPDLPKVWNNKMVWPRLPRPNPMKTATITIIKSNSKTTILTPLTNKSDTRDVCASIARMTQSKTVHWWLQLPKVKTWAAS